jgi:hypothetical protein
MAMIVVIICQMSANVLTCIFQCRPVAGAWDTSLKPKCVNINAFYLSNAALNILTDLITYALPTRMVLNLHTTKRQKVVVGVMFGLGFLYVLLGSPPIPQERSAILYKETFTDTTQCMYLIYRPHDFRTLYAVLKRPNLGYRKTYVLVRYRNEHRHSSCVNTFI